MLNWEWEETERYLNDVIASYLSLVNTPGVSVGFAVKHVNAVKSRFDAGERTEALYDEIMSLK